VPNICIYWPSSKYTGIKNDTWFAVLMALSNGLLEFQGALDCVVYGFTNREFRSKYSGLYGILQGIFAPILLPFIVGLLSIRACKRVWYRMLRKQSSHTPLLQEPAASAEVRGKSLVFVDPPVLQFKEINDDGNYT